MEETKIEKKNMNWMPAMAIAVIAIALIAILYFFNNPAPSNWNQQEMCIRWEAYTQQDFDNGMNCPLDSCIKSTDDPWVEDCFCPYNNKTVSKICTQKQTFMNYTGQINQVDYNTIVGGA